MRPGGGAVLKWGLSWLAWCVGVAVQLQQVALWPVWGYWALLLGPLGVGLVLRRRAGPGWSRSLLGCVVCGAAAFSLTGWHALSRASAMDPALEGRDLDVVGVVQAMPQRQDLGWRFRFRIEQAWLMGPAGQPQTVALHSAVPAQVYLGWYGQDGVSDSGWSRSALPEPVRAGERWRLRVRLKAPHGHMNPRGFDYELWLWEQGIRATGYVRTGAHDPAPVRLASTWAHPVEAWRQSVRDQLLTHLSGAAAHPESLRLAGIVAALVTGDQAAIDRSDWDVFRATGVAHLMSISGLHVTMFAWLASSLIAWLWRRSALWGLAGTLHWPAQHVGALAGLVLSGAYALFSGWGVPAQRTWWMLLVVVLLKVSARQWPAGMICLLAAAVVLALDPWALLQPGFWLSFVAVGVLMATGQQEARSRQGAASVAAGQACRQPGDRVPLERAQRRDARTRPVGGMRLLQALGSLLKEQATLTLALAPLTLLFFGQVSLVGLLANMLAIPWVTLVVMPLAMLGVLVSDAWHLAVWALQPMAQVLGGLAAWPLASVSTAMPPWGLAALAMVGAVGGVLQLPVSWKLLCLPLLWPVLLWSPQRPDPGQFELLAVDVGQGNAVLVRTATHSLLYDAGPRYSPESDAGHRVLVPMLAQMGERIDTLMLSHRDSDHTGGAAAVLTMQPQAQLWSSLEDEHALHRMRPQWVRCQAGQSWVWDGVLLEVLHPPVVDEPLHADRGGHAQASRPWIGSTMKQRGSARTPRPNEVSCVLRISSGKAAALLTGDIEVAQELALVQAGLAPVDVLLVPHHGSRTSSSEPFLQALQPRLALVQAGYRNRFAHPAQEVVARYRAQGIALVESTRCGAATWRSESPGQVQCERERARRYWHHTLRP